MRLDLYLVSEGVVDSRNKAQELIRGGKVRVDGHVVRKPSHPVAEARVEADTGSVYVSRAALKLKHFLPELPFVPQGMHALDVGASTGGFTQVLLEAGAARVDAVDVGQGQLHPLLRHDERVRSVEETDIRRFEAPTPYELVTSDVSFISLHHILDAIDRLASRWIVLLFKPQFEVGRDVKRDRAGVIRDDAAVEAAMKRFEEAALALGWTLRVKAPSAITGKEGNLEYCYCFEKS